MRINININITTIIVRFVILLLFAGSCYLAMSTTLYKSYYEREMISTSNSDLIDVLNTIRDQHFAKEMRGAKYNVTDELIKQYGYAKADSIAVAEGNGYISDKQLRDYITNRIHSKDELEQVNKNELSRYIEYLNLYYFLFALFFVVLLIHLTSTIIRKINNNKSSA